MKLRPPSTPLITVDPYFSIWSAGDKLNYSCTQHWTGTPHSLLGMVIVDGVAYNFLGYDRNFKKIEQTKKEISALSSEFTFENELIKVNAVFTSTLLADDLYYLSRPISYLTLSYEKKSDNVKNVEFRIATEKSICLDCQHQSPVVFEELNIKGLCGYRFGNSVQEPLNKSGDDIRIDWGYFYCACVGSGTVDEFLIQSNGEFPSCTVKAHENEEKLFMFAYDDIYSINYFGTPLKAYWKKDNKSLEDVLIEASNDYLELKKKCDSFSSSLYAESYQLGGEKYAELLSLAYRQVMAAHKLVLDDKGDEIFISKECFSNGCAATVDISYPSMPLFLRYNPKLLYGMLRPIYKYAESEKWPFDFAPHDVGQYPLLLGQVYGYDRDKKVLKHEDQMPVEESGNIIIMEANLAIVLGNADFSKKHLEMLKSWAQYLIQYGDDPENQLCTDDFAGHLAHNCNLSLKAIVGIMGMSIIMNMLGERSEAEAYEAIAREKAKSWSERAKNTSGAFRLTFDKDNTYSMKYNMIWDKLWGTNLFSEETYASENTSNLKRINKYGLPLDSRCDQTKSDWLVWCATMMENKEDFEKMISPLWQFYNDTPDRVPMSDWYDSVSGHHIMFRNRTVQGGLYIKLLDGGILKYNS